MARSKAGSARRLKRNPYLVLLLLLVVLALYIKDWVIESDAHPVSNPGAPISTSGELVSVHFLNVGQSESILIVAPEKTVLIDAGENDSGAYILDYFKQVGTEKLDLAIGTHPHADHIGGMDDVINHIPVGEYWMSEIPDAIVPTTKTFTDLLDALENNAVTTRFAAPGDHYDLGGGAVLTVLGPVRAYADLNNISLVCRLQVDGISFLFTGDMEKDAEKDLLAENIHLKSDVLSIGHHGSNTSSTKEFLSAVSPSVAVISCGLGNRYGHPHEKVLERLGNTSAALYRTDLHGWVVVSTDGREIEITTEK